MGSGAVLRSGDRSVVVTCYHVVRGQSVFRVMVEGGDWQGASLLGVDSENDLAVLSANSLPDGAGLADPTGSMRFFGYSGGRGQNPRVGILAGSHSRPEGYRLSVPAIPGDSGSGVYTDGGCVGIVYATDGRQAYVTGPGPIRRLLARLFPFCQPGPSPSPGAPPAQPDSGLRAELQKALDRIAALEKQGAAAAEAADAHSRRLLAEIEKLKSSPIFLDVLDGNGAMSSTSGTLGGKRLQLRFNKAQ